MHVYIALDQYVFRNNMTNASGKERHQIYTLIWHHIASVYFSI